MPVKKKKKAASLSSASRLTLGEILNAEVLRKKQAASRLHGQHSTVRQKRITHKSIREKTPLLRAPEVFSPQVGNNCYIGVTRFLQAVISLSSDDEAGSNGADPVRNEADAAGCRAIPPLSEELTELVSVVETFNSVFYCIFLDHKLLYLG
jgi:hypothetical protein